jgi:hypothetical protein
MAEKFNPAPTDKHAEPLEDVRFSPSSENPITSALPLVPPRMSTEYGPLVAQK